MKRFVTASALVVAVVILGSAAFSQSSHQAGASMGSMDKTVERGGYLVRIMGCSDCHTPLKMGANGPEPDRSMMLAGHPEKLVMPQAPKLEQPWMAVMAGTMTAYAGPWGVSYASNLTPDKETGLGEWSEDEFIATVRSGRHRGRGRPILPPMPVQVLQHLTDEDLHAVYAYLHSLPAIHNKVPAPQLAQQSE